MYYWPSVIHYIDVELEIICIVWLTVCFICFPTVIKGLGQDDYNASTANYSQELHHAWSTSFL